MISYQSFVLDYFLKPSKIVSQNFNTNNSFLTLFYGFISSMDFSLKSSQYFNRVLIRRIHFSYGFRFIFDHGTCPHNDCDTSTKFSLEHIIYNLTLHLSLKIVHFLMTIQIVKYNLPHNNFLPMSLSITV